MFINNYFENIDYISKNIDRKKINQIVTYLVKLKKSKGRIFFLGVGGSAANCSHAVNDFRKLCGIESYTPTDNVAELTARTNDEGWSKSFDNWLKISQLKKNDIVIVFSVGGGNLKRKISLNIVNAIKFCKKNSTKVISIVGKKDGYSYKHSNCSLVIPINDKKLITPLSEAYQAVIWHLLVSHPKLQSNKTTW
ncbi:SIS domain-containing protein [Candidatus Pelagibacter ubique]|nr:SIS domain-containing protein [Candidatus Pelagibacter ubique]